MNDTKRKATAHWEGSGATGTGTLNTDSGALSSSPYSYKSRFENAKGTNSEELIAAAHAGCFAMKLSFLLTDAGHAPDSLDATCTISFDAGVITRSHLELKAQVSGMEVSSFEAALKDAKANCPVSQVIKAKISLNYSLNGAGEKTL